MPTYTVKPNAKKHSCWNNPSWDGCLTDGCEGCNEAKEHRCQWCGYGHAFTTHSPLAHCENDDPQMARIASLDAMSPLTDAEESELYAWCDSPHLYTKED